MLKYKYNMKGVVTMVFSNMSDIKQEYSRNKGKSFPLVMTSERVIDCSIYEERGNIVIGNNSDGVTNLFEIKGNDEDVFSETYKMIKKRVKTPEGTYKRFVEKVPEVSLTYSQVKDTPDNPLVVVKTNGIKFYDGISTYLKVLLVDKENVVVMLVYGACEFKLDNEFIPLERCCEGSVYRQVSKEYSAKDLMDLVNLKTEMGTDLKFDSVCPLLVSLNKGNFSVKVLKDSVVPFNRESIETYEKNIRIKREEKIKALRAKSKAEEKAKEERLKGIEEILNAEREEKKLKELKEEEEKLREKEAKRQLRKATKKPKKETANLSAADFLNIVNSL